SLNAITARPKTTSSRASCPSAGALTPTRYREPVGGARGRGSLDARGGAPDPGAMNREEASQALELLKRVVSQARDDTALQNWGTIWVLHGFTNSIAFVATNLLLRSGHATPLPYAVLWTAVLVFNLATIFLLKSGSSGVRSFVENQIWMIWSTFVVASAL